MSNYNSLKTTIDANIKQNGRQEITGEILNSVLNQMVNILGTGYQFAGVATTATNPGTPDAKVFYIANGKGTYTNFSGLEVTEDEVVVLYWDTAWHKEATGIASYEKLSELGTQVIYDVTANNDGVTFTSLSALLSSENLSTLIPSEVRCGGMSIRFLQSSDNKYVQYSLMSDTFNTTLANWQGVDDEPTFGSDNLVKSGGVHYEIQRISSIEWYNEFTDVPNENGYIDKDGGVVKSDSSRYTDFISVSPGNIYFIKKPFIIQQAALAIYDENKTFIRAIDDTSSALDDDGNLTLSINENERYIRVSFKNGNFPKYISVQNAGIYGGLKDSSVTTEKLKEGSVTTEKLKEGSVTLPKLSDSVTNIFSVAYPITTDNTQPGFIAYWGTLQNFNESRSTDYLLVKKGVPVVISKPFVQQDSAIVLYDKTKTMTRAITESEVGVNPETVVVVPNENESYLRVSYWNTKIPNVIYYDAIIDKSTLPGSVFDIQDVIDGGFIDTEGGVIKLDGFAYTDYIKLPQGIKFKIVNKTVDLASFAIYNSNKSVSRVILSSDVSGQEYIDFTLSGDETYIRATFRTGDVCNVLFDEIVTKCDLLKRIGVETAKIQSKGYNILAAFDNIVCVGDSLTVSAVYTAENSVRQAKRPYPTVLGKLCGNDTTILASSGATAKVCWDEFGSQIVAKTNPLAIIYLGTNYGLTDTLDTDVVGNDPDNWSDNNIGCYCRFVQKFQSLGYKVLLLKCWVTSGTGTANLANTNSAIKHTGERFGCSVMDVPASSDLKYHYFPDLSGYNYVHYNDLGYSWFASALISAVSDLETDEMKFIIPK